MEKRLFREMPNHYTDEFRHKIIQEFLSTECTKNEIWEKYTGQKKEHGIILRWMRTLGYITDTGNKSVTIVSNLAAMSKSKPNEQDFETLQLQKRISELEKQLKDAEFKAIAFSTMIDIAEKELKIPIRKKLNTKP